MIDLIIEACDDVRNRDCLSAFPSLDGVSDDARMFFYAGVALAWSVGDEGVPVNALVVATGLPDGRFDRAGSELYDQGLAWPYLGETWHFSPVNDLLKRAIGPVGRPSSIAWAALKERAFAYHGRQCLYCRAKADLALDHVLPLRLGGSNHGSNLVPACKSCNSAKGGKSWADWFLVWKGGLR